MQEPNLFRILQGGYFIEIVIMVYNRYTIAFYLKFPRNNRICPRFAPGYRIPITDITPHFQSIEEDPPYCLVEDHQNEIATTDSRGRKQRSLLRSPPLA